MHTDDVVHCCTVTFSIIAGLMMYVIDETVRGARAQMNALLLNLNIALEEDRAHARKLLFEILG
ncbi:MAG: hypothetical protein ACRYG5_16860 [Janthinobacterium lividum]